MEIQITKVIRNDDIKLNYFKLLVKRLFMFRTIFGF